MKVQMETLRVGSCISHSWNKMANKKGVIMMLHHLTQLGGLGCLPACYKREREGEIPPVNNGTCTFMSVLCLRVNFENVWSVCHLPPLLPPPPSFSSTTTSSSSSPLSCLPCCCRMWSVFRLPLFDASYCPAVSKPRHDWRATTTTTPCCQPHCLLVVGRFMAPALMPLGESLFGLFVTNKVIFHVSWPPYNVFKGCNLIYRPWGSP